MSEDYFYGLEEIDYAYRVVDAGYEIYYEPGCWVVEHNDPGGRKPRQEVEEMRLTNKLIISFKYLPAIYLPLNFLMFSAYVFYLNRGRINVFRSFGNFLKWARQHPGPPQADRPAGDRLYRKLRRRRMEMRNHASRLARMPCLRRGSSRPCSRSPAPAGATEVGAYRGPGCDGRAAMVELETFLGRKIDRTVDALNQRAGWRCAAAFPGSPNAGAVPASR